MSAPYNRNNNKHGQRAYQSHRTFIPQTKQEREVVGLVVKWRNDFFALRSHPVALGTRNARLDQQFETLIQRAVTPISDIEEFLAAMVRCLYAHNPTAFREYMMKSDSQYLSLWCGNPRLLTSSLRGRDRFSLELDDKKSFKVGAPAPVVQYTEKRQGRAALPRNKQQNSSAVRYTMDGDKQMELLKQLDGDETTMSYLEVATAVKPAETKTETKAETKAETKVETKVETPAETKVETKPVLKKTPLRFSEPTAVLTSSSKSWGDTAAEDDEEEMKSQSD